MKNKSTGNIIGRCGLHNWNTEHKRAEIGYHIVEEIFKRKGFKTVTVSGDIEYGFTKLNLHRIEALVGSNNIPSLKLLKKHNFIREGLLRQHCFTANKHEDFILFSKLFNEYQNEMKN